MEQAINVRAGDNQPMLTETYIEALLIDEELADQVWEAQGVFPTQRLIVSR